MPGDVKKRRVLEVALDPAVQVHQRIVEVVGDVLVELVVLGVADFLLVARPDGRRRVHRLLTGLVLSEPQHLHGKRDMVGVAVHDGSQACPVEKRVLVLTLAKAQHHPGSAFRHIQRLHGEIAFAARLPAHALCPRQARPARCDRDVVGDHEACVEADTELADQLGILGRVARQRLEELTGSGFRDGAQIFDDLVAAHADAVVADGNRARLFVETDVDIELAVTFVE